MLGEIDAGIAESFLEDYYYILAPYRVEDAIDSFCL